MKILNFILPLFLLTVSLSFAQQTSDTTKRDSNKIYVIIKNDRNTFVGKIISQDAREVLVETKNVGQVIIPKHEIKEIKEVKSGDLSLSGEYIPEEVFSTRYFITTNGLPIEKGESYIQWNLFGPDFQFGLGKNFGVGIMTTWIGVPIIGSVKYSIQLSEGIHLGVGTLLGTGSYALPDFGIALPFGTLTFGDRKRNLTFSGGYGAVIIDGSSNGRALFSVAGMAKMTKYISFVFDSFIMTDGPSKLVSQTGYTYDPFTGSYNYYTYYVDERKPGFVLLIPGLRWQFDSNKAFQFGFVGLRFDKEFLPYPFPMVQWYRKL